MACCAGRLPGAAPPFGDGAKDAATHLRNVFYRMGFDDREIVALSGAHTMGRAFKERSGKVAFGYGDTGGTKHTASSAVVRADGKPGVGMPGGESWTSNWLTFDNSYFKSVGCTFSPRPTNSFFRLRPAPLFSLRRRTTSSSCGCQRTWRSPRTQAFGRTTSAMLHRRRHSSRTTRRRTRSCPSWGPLSIPQAACASDSDHRQTPAATTTTTTTADDGTRKNHDAR